MPPEPWEYQGPTAIGVFLRDREVRRGAPLRLVPTRANTQPAFGCYLPVPRTDIARPYALFVLTLEGDRISAITWFGDSSVFPHFGLPRMLREESRGIRATKVRDRSRQPSDTAADPTAPGNDRRDAATSETTRRLSRVATGRRAHLRGRAP
jgi:hypothetical protein